MNRVLVMVCSVLFSALAAAATDTAYETHPLPEGLAWLTDNEQPLLGAPEAKRGGRFTTHMSSYPLTFRTVGPDSNGSFRSALLDNQLTLVMKHPITEKIVPQLATHWAFGDDGRTIYYKLDPRARWSDGVPVTADDYLFQWDFMRSKHIVAPWYNNHYGEHFESVKKYDDYTISITGKTIKPGIDLFYYYGMSPRARHFHILDKDWVRAYNWRIEPNTGPYQVERFKAGKFIELKRKDDWWANDLRYFKHRYNPDIIRYQVIRDPTVAFKYFEKGYIDAFPLILPDHWINKTKGEVFTRGLVERITFYTDTFRAISGIYLNQQLPLFQDSNVRMGLAYAMNFDKIINGLLNGDYARLNTLYVGYGEYSNEAIQVRPFDLAKAKYHFEQAGFNQRGGDGILHKANGERLSFTLLYTAEIHTPRLLVLKEEAKKAGVEMVLQRLDGSTMFKTVLEKKHEASWLAWGGGYRPQFWGAWHSDNANKPQTNNITNTANSELDNLIDRFRASTSGEERAALSRQMIQIIHDEAYAIPRTYVPFTRWAHWRWLKLPAFVGVPDSNNLFEPFGDTGGFFWIDEEIKQATQQVKKGDETFPLVERVNTTYKEKH